MSMDKEIIRYTEVNGITVIENPAADFPSHWHNAAEFTVILKDGCRFRIGDKEYAPNAGDILLIWPRELHEVLHIPPQGSMFIQFASSIIENNSDLAAASRLSSRFHLITHSETPDLNVQIKDRIFKIKDFYNNKQHFIETKCKLLVYEILLLIGEYVMNEQRDQVLLIRQYGRPVYVLVAGYVNRGEDAEAAAAREVMEEVGLEVLSARFNHSHYFAPTNTLMLNFTVTVRQPEVHANWEVDDWRWFSVEEARKNIKPNSLAEAFLNGYFTGEYPF